MNKLFLYSQSRVKSSKRNFILTTFRCSFCFHLNVLYSEIYLKKTDDMMNNEKNNINSQENFDITTAHPINE